MASGDILIKVLLGVTVVILIAGGQGGGSTPAPDPSDRPGDGNGLAPSPSVSTNIPGGVLTSCAGRPIATESAAVGERGELVLQVFYTSDDGGRTCAMVTKTGTARTLRGELVTRLQFHNYDGRRWPRYAVLQVVTDAGRSEGVYLDRTDRKCVRAWARFRPDRGPAVRITSGKVGCG